MRSVLLLAAALAALLWPVVPGYAQDHRPLLQLGLDTPTGNCSMSPCLRGEKLLAHFGHGVLVADSDQSVLVIPGGERVDGDVSTTEQAVVVEGEVLGDVTSWSGDITVRGLVHGDVVSYSGSVVIAPGAVIDGNVLALMGEVNAEDAAIIGGRRFAPEPTAATASLVGLVVPNTPAPPLALRAALVGGLVLLLVALCLIFPALWPKRSAATLAMLWRHPWYSLGFGLLTSLLLALLLPMLLALLALTLVGLLLVLPLLLMVGLIYSYGVAVSAQLLGRRLSRHEWPAASLLGVLLLVLPLAALSLVAPLLGLGLFCLLGSAGLGAAALSKGGTLLLA